jgi:uncharacterized protein (UPF0335 family)
MESRMPEAETIDYQQARDLVIAHGKASTSWLQRQLGVEYNTAAQLIERMEADGVVSAPDHVGRRTVLGVRVGLEALAEQAFAIGARVMRGDDGHTQITIPVDLPERHRSTDDRFRLLIERIERLEGEKKGIADDIRDVYSELKAVGYDARVARQIVRLRKMRPDDRREMEEILDLYKAALGLG